MGVGLQGSVCQIVVVDLESFPVTPDHSAESSLLCQVCLGGTFPGLMASIDLSCLG